MDKSTRIKFIRRHRFTKIYMLLTMRKIKREIGKDGIDRTS